MKQLFVHLERCVGCHSCEVACALEHSKSKSLFLSIKERPVPHTRIYVEGLDDQKIPLTCRHCEDAPCISACIPGAMHRSLEGVVKSTQGAQKCIGCSLCLMACPYGVIVEKEDLDGRVIALKCDLCPERSIPACVEACPTQAIVFAEPQDFAKIQRQGAMKELWRSLLRKRSISSDFTQEAGYF